MRNPIMILGNVPAADETPYVLRGWKHYIPYQEFCKTAEDALYTTKYAVDYNWWCPTELVNPNGDVIMDREALLKAIGGLEEE